MATYALIHGASSDSWYWHLVAPALRRRGHDVVAPDLPSDDDRCGFEEYADAVVDAIGDRSDVVLVAQSLGGFTAPLVCERIPVRLLVLVAAMVPTPGEAPGDWWTDTGWERARREDQLARGDTTDGVDPLVDFFHDVPADVVAEAMARGERPQSGTPFTRPLPLTAWPDVPTRFLLCRDDRFFPATFLRRVVGDRLGLVADELASGHLPALAHPDELVEALERYRIEEGLPPR
ncbi:MAG TPA: alpha/beta hydrolase [Acidimicrobiia bacterium]|nr:alpha/beta hydrolase [Acidimicrobiia bacterium]